MSALEEIKESYQEDGGLVFYSFNPRMIPDDVDSKPVLQKLRLRSDSELEILRIKNEPKQPKLPKAKKRKSISCKPSPKKKATKG